MSVAQIGSRALFERLEPPIYLNHASVAPLSSPALDAMQRAMHDFAARGIGAALDWVNQREALRATLASRIHAPGPDTIALVPNTSQALLTVALSMPWRRGDKVVLFHDEFPANVTPWQSAAKLFELELVWLDAGAMIEPSGAGLEALERACAQGVRLIAISAVQFQTGWRMPLGAITAIAARYGAQVCVDGIQACGVVPLDVSALGIDYLAVGGHKWMMGTEGAGFLYVREDRINELVPRTAGWLSHEAPFAFLSAPDRGELRADRPLRKRADVVEPGSHNTWGYAALEASLRITEALPISTIFAHVSAYLDALEEGLMRLGCESVRSSQREAQSGILSVRLPAGHALLDTHAKLAARGVSCATPDGHLRFSPHWPNSLDEVPRVLDAMTQALASEG